MKFSSHFGKEVVDVHRFYLTVTILLLSYLYLFEVFAPDLEIFTLDLKLHGNLIVSESLDLRDRRL